jgi:signal transduction histidine kinase
MAILDDALTDLHQRIAALERELDARTAERDEALAQQSGAAEVLQVINSSPGDLAPVFEAVLDKATRLCGASFGALTIYRGDDLHEVVAMRGMAPSINDLLGKETGMGRPPQDLTRVFLNLFGNGFYAADKRGKEANEKTFRPTLKVTTRDLGANVEIRVRDNVAGIPPEVKEKLFQPFFTTKPTGEGTGLGLSISYDIVAQQHGGTITVDSREGEFTEFTVRLPRSRQGATSRMNA